MTNPGEQASRLLLQPKWFRKWQAKCGATRADMLERRCCCKAGGLTQLVNQLPGIEGVEQVDVANVSVQDPKR